IQRDLRFQVLEGILDRYLASSPLAHALFRAAEAKHVRELAIRRPVLDLGCGFGEFASIAFRTPVEVGIDISDGQLAGAKSANGHERLRRADARELPFPDGQFR